MKLFHLVVTVLLVFVLLSCGPTAEPKATDMEPVSDTIQPPANLLSGLHQRLYEAYDTFKEASITDRRFKHADVEPLLLALDTLFQVQSLGESVEGRPIYEVQIGSGETPVLLWSQMHGDEPTATMALLDIFNFFQASGDGFDELRQLLRTELSLHFIPLLNPDGAEVYERRNALGVDLNRDALRLQSPESRILKAARERTQAVWGFNLHDQNRYYAAGNHPNTASVSFLAPAYNEAKDVDEGRGDAMQLIVLMNEMLQQYIPGKVGRYDDTFEPRAFGDNMQKWGTNTILIESGGLAGDREKQYLRKLHFIMILTALEAIASGAYEEAPQTAYETIPYNASADYHDLILREVEREYEGKAYITDIAFRLNEVSFNDNKSFYLRAHISDIGDLSTQYGYDEFDGEGYRLVSGRTYEQVLADYEALQQLDLSHLLRQGYTTFQLKQRPSRSLYYTKPVEVVSPGTHPANKVRLFGNPSLLLEKNGTYQYAVINGQLYEL
ncbi:MAG TPA: M14 family zinc carboxypeptidase [Phaeodactylibacter sp.]|nr:M14 family zinc carboxypeptidase [Phaeodactylibacter sp.]